MTSYTLDTFLGGRVTARQARCGYRAGLDAVMLAASVPATNDCELLELGSGAGVASLCLAHRVTGCTVLGVEIDPQLAKLANESARANGMGERVRFEAADVFSPPAEFKREFDHVFTNPPFHDSEGEKPPDDARERALHDRGRLGVWLEEGVRRVASGGTFTTIIRADRLAEAMRVLPDRGVTIFPLWPRAGAPAKRAVLQLQKGSGASLTVHSGLVLHETDGRFTAAAQAVLRDGASLALGKPRR